MSIFGKDNLEKKPGQPPQAEKTIMPGSDQQRVGNKPPVREDIETEMADLELKEIAKSTKTLNEIVRNQFNNKEERREVVLIRPWGDYTLVVLKNGDELKIYNDQAQPVDSFKKPHNLLRSKPINLAALPRSRGHNRIINDIDNPGSYNTAEQILLSQVKNEVLKSAALVRMRKENRVAVGFDYYSAPAESLLDITKNFQILEGGKYILTADKDGEIFIAFNTQNEQGVTQAPKDWVRLEMGVALPPDLERYVKLAMERKDELRPLNDKYFAYITEVGINIVPADNPKSTPLFKDNVVGVGDNVCVDAGNKNSLYYCAATNPKELRKLDMSASPNEWSVRVADFQKSYVSIRNLQMDPSGNFLLFYSDNDLVLVTKETLEEVKRMPGMTNVNFDAQGRIRAIDKDGHLVILEMDADKIVQSLAKRRVSRLAQGIDLADIFASAARKKGIAPAEMVKDLAPIRQEWEQKLQNQLNSVANIEQAQGFKQGLAKLRQTLEQQGLNAIQINFITEGLSEKIIEKERTLAGGEISIILGGVETKLQGSLSLAAISEVKADLEQLMPLELLMDEATKQRYREVNKNFSQQSADLFRREGDKILQDIQGLVKGVKTQLDQMSSKTEFDDWTEFRFPQLKNRLGALMRDCPIEADTAYKAIAVARGELQTLADQYKVKFEKEYAQIREVAAERTDALVENLRGDVNDIVNRLRTKGFKTREDAETYLSSSEAKKVIEQEIASLSNQNPDAAKELERALKVQLSNTLSEIERGGLAKVAETGQQMIIFGKTEFPRWEAKVKKEGERKVELIFQPDAKTQGPGLTANKILGDVELVITDTHGKKDTVRLYEGWDEEHEWRFGLLSYRGEEVPPSYLPGGDFRAVRKQYAEWVNGKLRNQYEAQKRQLFDLYKQRQKIGQRDEQTDAAWQEQYQQLLSEYGKFCAENHIALFRRIDQVKNMNEVSENGKGFVPGWQSHWVVDADAEKNLERMAQLFKMQLDLHEGVLNLKGHAGTGKDVLIKMFCNRVNRPYFATDCTKWTTEYELGEDVVLEAKDGGTQTVKVPSAVLNGIQTPGAVVYFNEVNGMPEQAQIFLHALWDEKRSLTLKTSSGKVIKADPTALFASSMNPNYPGTFNPQFATRSRMVSLEIGYPPLLRAKDANDANPNQPYNASEPLRIAREVKSLADMTYEPNMSRNDFVKLWDNYVNGVQNGAAKPTRTQEFDINVILALVEFGNRMRENFILNFEKTRESRNALPVKQPLTSREFRRCAYALGQIPETEKVNRDPDNTAREFLEQYFLSNVDSSEDRDKIMQAMRTWRSQKRVAA